MGPSPEPALARDSAAGTAIAVLGVSNVVTNRWLHPVAYVPWNLAMAAVLVLLARRSGCNWADLGADPRDLRRGLRVGAAGAGVVVGAYGFLLAAPGAADVFRDERATSVGTRAALWHLSVRIPLGTVIAEEVAFRGVLPALLTSSPLLASFPLTASLRSPAWLPGAVASLLFGMWHVLPSRSLAKANVGVGRVVGGRTSGYAVALAVATTTMAGGALHLLRQRSGHLAAPVAVHLATNVLGFLGARLVGGAR